MFNLKPNRAKVSPVIFHFTGSKQKGSADMPTKRILLTLGDIKHLVAKKYESEKESVKVFDGKELQLEDYLGGTFEVKDDNYLFQIDFEAK